MRWQLPHSFLVNSKKTNFPSRVALWIASSTLVAQIALPGPIPVGSAIFGEASEPAVGTGRGAPDAFEGAAGSGAARAAERKIGRRKLKTDLQRQCDLRCPKRSGGVRHSPERAGERGAQGRN